MAEQLELVSETQPTKRQAASTGPSMIPQIESTLSQSEALSQSAFMSLAATVSQSDALPRPAFPSLAATASSWADPKRDWMARIQSDLTNITVPSGAQAGFSEAAVRARLAQLRSEVAMLARMEALEKPPPMPRVDDTGQAAANSSKRARTLRAAEGLQRPALSKRSASPLAPQQGSFDTPPPSEGDSPAASSLASISPCAPLPSSTAFAQQRGLCRMQQPWSLQPQDAMPPPAAAPSSSDASTAPQPEPQGSSSHKGSWAAEVLLSLSPQNSPVFSPRAFPAAQGPAALAPSAAPLPFTRSKQSRLLNDLLSTPDWAREAPSPLSMASAGAGGWTSRGS